MLAIIFGVKNRASFEMIDIAGLTNNLSLDETGIWTAKQNEKISYPSDGNELCAEIEENSFWFKHRNEVIKTALQNFPPSGAIFDVGGGNGFVACALVESGFECVLVEPGITGSRIALQRGLKNVICATLSSSGFLPNSLHGVGLFDVLEHIEDDLSFLLNLHNLLSDDGKIYLTVPAYNLLWSNEDVNAGHFRRYNRKSLTKVFEGAGFQIKYVSYFFCFLPPAIFMLRTIPTFLGFRQELSSETAQNEHKAQTGLSGKIVDKINNWELSQIRKCKTLPIGASLLAVAQK